MIEACLWISLFERPLAFCYESLLKERNRIQAEEKQFKNRSIKGFHFDFTGNGKITKMCMSLFDGIF